MPTNSQEALRRLGARLISCDHCERLVQDGMHWFLVAFVDGEMVDWDRVACSKEHAAALRDMAAELPDFTSARGAGADISFSIIEPQGDR